MKQPIYNSNWPESWKKSFDFDELEVFGKQNKNNLGYIYAYKRRQQQTLTAVKQYIPQNGSVLDIAAAQGNFSLSLAESGFKVTWNDLRSELEDYVKLKYEFGDIKYLSGNCLELNIKEQFDAILLTEVIEHTAHPDQFLSKVSSLLSPNGIIIITTPNGNYFRNKLPKFSNCDNPEKFEDIEFGPDSDDHIFLLYKDEIYDLANKAEMDIVKIKSYSNFFTNGRLKSNLLLPFIPKVFINTFEKITSLNNGSFFHRLNTNMLTILKKRV